MNKLVAYSKSIEVREELGTEPTRKLPNKVAFGKKSIQIDNIARILICLGLFFLPISTSLGQLIVVGSVLALFGSQFKKHFKWLWTSKITYFSIALSFCFILSAFCTSHNTSLAIHQAFKYAEKLVLLLFLFPLFIDKHWRRSILTLLIIVTLIFTSCFYLQTFNLISFDLLLSKPINKLLSPIPWCLWVSFSIFILINRLVDERHYRMINSLSLLYLLFFIFFVNVERSGMLVTLALLFLVPIQRIGKKGILIGLLSTFLISGIVYTTSPSVQHRFKQAVFEAKTFKNQKHVFLSSIGMRLSFLHESIHLIKQKPLFGHGTGSFRDLYHPTYMPSFIYDLFNKDVFGDPHNVYFHITLQIGLLGLLIFIGWMLAYFLETRSLPLIEKRLSEGLILIFIVGSNFEEGLLRTRISTFYITILLILLAANFLNRSHKLN